VINSNPYVLVGDVATLAFQANANPAGFFALANSYNAAQDGTYTRPPILSPFTGIFEGLGNTISQLAISDSINDSFLGLFSIVDVGGAVRDVFVKEASIERTKLQTQVDIGAVAGLVRGTLIGDYATCRSLSGVTGAFIGGLAGYVANGAIIDSHAHCNIRSDLFVLGGGLIGKSQESVLELCSASGNIVVPNGEAGGLAAALSGTVDQSFASGSVSGSEVGGLVAEYAGGNIMNSYATGAVHNTGQGGFSRYEVGGLVGSALGYPTVTQSSYSTGLVSGLGFVGGVVGYNVLPNPTIVDFVNTYWDLTASGVPDPHQGAGNMPDDPGITGIIDEQLKAGLPEGFEPAIWGYDPNINNGWPYLLANAPQMNWYASVERGPR
jgi:hypothetical protein